MKNKQDKIQWQLNFKSSLKLNDKKKILQGVYSITIIRNIRTQDKVKRK